ncbi:Phenazine biosynthesis protein PhzF like [hydrothermal vent metagenome]|uniref:Phenazine biosynthesis protein PhzF like n=1 Tax=hydrothermal vent metagenome TaxID=652676 RepID=A0A3B0T4D7_9ZZZZ
MNSPLHVAAFTSDPAGGNMAGVVFGEHGTPAEMMATAAEVGYSETAFLAATDDPSVWLTRYFAPETEVDFCGHATIGAGGVLGGRYGPGRYTLQTNIGEIPVDVSVDDVGDVRVTLTSIPPTEVPLTDEAFAAALVALGYLPDDLDDAFPPAVFNAGVNHLMVPLKNRGVLASLDYDFAALKVLTEAENWTTVNCFVRTGHDEYHARNPFPIGGIVEDPATGAAAAAFGGYLAHHNFVDVPGAVQVFQGYDMDSPSQIAVDIPGDAESGIRVSGSAVVLAEPFERQPTSE